MRERSIMFLVLTVLTVPAAAAAASGKAGNAVTVVGDALVRNVGGDKPSVRELKNGDTLVQGDIINTGSKGQVKVLLADKSIIDLGPTTLFKVDEFKLKDVQNREVALSVDYGKIRGNVPEKIGKKGKFRIQTKTATMGVRGTEFIVLSDLVGLPGAEGTGGGEGGGTDDAASKNGTKIVVVEGTVEVETEEKKEESHTITTGQQLVAVEEEEDENEQQEGEGAVEEGVAVEVSTLTQEEVAEVKEEVEVEDQTFEQQVVVDETSAGDDTLAAFEDSFTLPEDFVPGVQDFGTPGLFGPDVGFGGSYYPGLVGETVKVTVVFQP